MNLLKFIAGSAKVVTRIAPSPTGPFHIGTARTALFNYLFAKHHGGLFLLRIEDTDKKRSKDEFEQDITSGLSWLQLPYDGFKKQSLRTDIYHTYIEQLIENKNAYSSMEASKDDPTKTVELIRLKNPNKNVTFHDLIRGDITFNTAELGDFVVAKSRHEPLYNLTVIIDDFEMGVTHVIRGEDHISNTPRQILIQEALGIKRPYYAHLPLILASDRSKLSKRHGSVSLSAFKNGYLPEAMINYLALLGWNPGVDDEIFSLEELVKLFDIAKVQKGGAIFDIDKLDATNRQYINRLDEETLLAMVIEKLPKRVKQLEYFSEKILSMALPLIRERIKTFDDVTTLAENRELDFYFARPEYEAKKLLGKNEHDLEKVKVHLETLQGILKQLDEKIFSKDRIKAAVWNFATKEGRGAVLWPMRYALTGLSKSPDPFIVSEILGKDETLARLRVASGKIK